MFVQHISWYLFKIVSTTTLHPWLTHLHVRIEVGSSSKKIFISISFGNEWNPAVFWSSEADMAVFWSASKVEADGSVDGTVDIWPWTWSFVSESSVMGERCREQHGEKMDKNFRIITIENLECLYDNSPMKFIFLIFLQVTISRIIQNVYKYMYNLTLFSTGCSLERALSLRTPRRPG